MAHAERDHWWYRALHHLLLRRLEAHLPCKNGRILDAGCGTGGLLLFLRQHDYQNIFGYDISPWAVRICQDRGLPAGLGDLREFHRLIENETANAIISNDTLYFFTPQERISILQNFWNALTPGGLLLMNLPAMRGFRGIHDLSVGIQHRFSKEEISVALRSAGFDILQATYWPFLLSPFIYAARFWQRLHMAISADFEIQSDISSTPYFLNKGLEGITRLENAVLPVKPFGSSLFIVARKTLTATDSGVRKTQKSP